MSFDPRSKCRPLYGNGYASEANAHAAYHRKFRNSHPEDAPSYLVVAQDGRFFVVLRMEGKNPGLYLRTGFALIN